MVSNEKMNTWKQRVWQSLRTSDDLKAWKLQRWAYLTQFVFRLNYLIHTILQQSSVDGTALHRTHSTAIELHALHDSDINALLASTPPERCRRRLASPQRWIYWEPLVDSVRLGSAMVRYHIPHSLASMSSSLFAVICLLSTRSTRDCNHFKLSEYSFKYVWLALHYTFVRPSPSERKTCERDWVRRQLVKTVQSVFQRQSECAFVVPAMPSTNMKLSYPMPSKWVTNDETNHNWIDSIVWMYWRS